MLTSTAPFLLSFVKRNSIPPNESAVDVTIKRITQITKVTSMLVTDVGNQMGLWQVLDVGDKSRYQHQELVTNIKNRSPTNKTEIIPKIGRQHKVTNITMSN